MPSSNYKTSETKMERKYRTNRYSQEEKLEKNKRNLLDGIIPIDSNNPGLKAILSPIDFSEGTFLEDFYAKKLSLEEIYKLYHERVNTKKKVSFDNLPVLVTSCVASMKGGPMLSIKIGLKISFSAFILLRQEWKDGSKTKGLIKIWNGDDEIVSKCTVEGGEFTQQEFKVILTKGHQN